MHALFARESKGARNFSEDRVMSIVVCCECSVVARLEGRGMCRRCYRQWWASQSTSRPWSKHHERCVHCDQNDSRHAADGICNRCWQRERSWTNDAKARMRAYQQRYYATEHGQEVRKLYAARDDVRERKWLDNIRRREARVGILTPLPSGYVERAFEVFEERCVRCGTTERLELDHHRPLRDGHALVGNSVLLCRSCNARKHGRQPEAFYDGWTLAIIAMRLWELREWLREQSQEALC